MCYDCGCKLPYDDHGDSGHLVEKDFEKAAELMGDMEKVKKNVMELLKEQEEAQELDNPKKEY